MVPPIECDLGYRFASRTLPNLNPNPKTDPDPNPTSDNNVCSAKRQPNKVQDVINISYFRRARGGQRNGLYCKVVANDDD